jgi:putative aldouronate transport system permease protein
MAHSPGNNPLKRLVNSRPPENFDSGALEQHNGSTLKRLNSVALKRLINSRQLKRLNESKILLMMFIPALVHLIIFEYVPMFGIAVAFKDYNLFKGFWASPWVGFKNFKILFKNPDFPLLFRNTFLLGFYSLIYGFPAPIILSLLLNEVRCIPFKRFVQTVSYLPHFISNVVVASMVLLFLSPDGGMINVVIEKLGGTSVYFMSKPELFRPIYIATGIWQGIGWGTIIYLAAIAGVDVNLYEAAELDGAGRWRKMWHVTIPSIIPVIIILLIMNMGSIMSIGFERVLLLHNPLTYETADIFSTYTYRVGLRSGIFSYATAVGLFNSVMSLLLIITANYAARRWLQTSLW